MHSFSYSHMYKGVQFTLGALPYKDAYVQFNWSFLGKRIPPPPPPPCRFCKNFVHMKHHAPVQTVRERYYSRREKILRKLLRISSRQLMYRSRTLWAAAWCFTYTCKEEVVVTFFLVIAFPAEVGRHAHPCPFCFLLWVLKRPFIYNIIIQSTMVKIVIECINT